MASPALDTLAAEYVLGTLPARERLRAEKLCADDRRFAASVADWERRLAPLAETVPEEAPPSGLWRRIAASATPGAPNAHAAPGEFTRQIMALRQRLAVWRTAAFAAAAMAAVLLALWGAGIFPGGGAFDGERYVALLRGTEGKMAFLVTIDPENEQLLIRSMVPKPPQSKSYELWLIRTDGSVPATLGVVPPGEYMTMPVPGLIREQDLSAGAKLAISLEPQGGTPAGRPMGPVIFAGELVRQTP